MPWSPEFLSAIAVDDSVFEPSKDANDDECYPNARRCRLPKPDPARWWTCWDNDNSILVMAPREHDLSPENLIHNAAGQFRADRFWPFKFLGFLWDQFRLDVGLLGVTPIWNRVDQAQKLPDDEFDDADAEFEQDVAAHAPAKRRHAQPFYAHYGKDPVQVSSDEEIKQLLNASREDKLRRLHAFMQDPATAVQKFLGSSSHKGGLWWSNEHLLGLPKIVLYFLRYVLENNALLPIDNTTNLASIRHSLRDAINIAEKACIELPLTSAIQKVLPDAFNLGMKNAFIPFDEPQTKTLPSLLSGDKKCPDSAEAWQHCGTKDIWTPDYRSLTETLGMTTLPLTHALHPVAERSLRRIVSLYATSDIPGLGKVTLAPWKGWDVAEDKNIAEPIAVDTITGNSGANDVCKQSDRPIELFVLEGTVKVLKLGMGIYASWCHVLGPDEVWFMQDVRMVLPSYYKGEEAW